MSHSPSGGTTGTWQDEHKRQAFCCDLFGEPSEGALGSHQARVGSQEEVFHGSRIVQLVVDLLPKRNALACPTDLETCPWMWDAYLEGQGNLERRVTMGIIRVTIWVIGAINLLTKPPLTLQVGAVEDS